MNIEFDNPQLLNEVTYALNQGTTVDLMFRGSGSIRMSSMHVATNKLWVKARKAKAVGLPLTDIEVTLKAWEIQMRTCIPGWVDPSDKSTEPKLFEISQLPRTSSGKLHHYVRIGEITDHGDGWHG